MGVGIKYNNGVPGPAAESEKLDSSNPISTHSGTGETVTHNINVVGTKGNARRGADERRRTLDNAGGVGKRSGNGWYALGGVDTICAGDRCLRWDML